MVQFIMIDSCDARNMWKKSWFKDIVLHDVACIDPPEYVVVVFDPFYPAQSIHLNMEQKMK